MECPVLICLDGHVYHDHPLKVEGSSGKKRKTVRAGGHIVYVEKKQIVGRK